MVLKGLFNYISDAIITRSRCYKLIKYQDRSIEFKDIGGEYGGFKLAFGGFSIGLQNLVDSSESAKAIDDFQFQLCNDLENKRFREALDPNTWTMYIKARFAANALMLGFRVALEAFKIDPKIESENLNAITKDLRSFVNSVCKGDINQAYNSPDGLTAISKAIEKIDKTESELDTYLKSKFEESEKNQKKVMDAISNLQRNLQTTLLQWNSSENNFLTYPILASYVDGNPNCWKQGLFRDSDIKNYYDARRGITDGIITSLQNLRSVRGGKNHGVMLYGDSYTGKSLVLKRVIFELISKDYLIFFTDKLDRASYAGLQNLLQNINATHDRILIIVDNLHYESNQNMLKVFNTVIFNNITFLFSCRESYLIKGIPEIETALDKIPQDARYKLNFDEEDVELFLDKAIEVIYQGAKYANSRDFEVGRELLAVSQKDPYMFNLGLQYYLSGENVDVENPVEPEDFVEKKMKEIVGHLVDIEQENPSKKMWKEALVFAVAGIFGISFDLNPLSFAHYRKILDSTYVKPELVELLEKESPLVKRDLYNSNVYLIRDQRLAIEFLTYLYSKYGNQSAMFDREHRIYFIITCFWKYAEPEKLTDALQVCAYLYNDDRYRALSLLLTQEYLSSPIESFREDIIEHEKLKKLYCYGFGEYYIKIEDYKNAGLAYDKALKIDNNYIDALMNKGFALSNLGIIEEELECYNRAIALKPERRQHARALDNTSYYRYREKNIGEAIRINQEAIEMDSTYGNAFYNKAVYLVAKNKDDVQAAISSLQQAIELDPDLADEAKVDEDLKQLWNDPLFIKITN